jgi:hypothetical protein
VAVFSAGSAHLSKECAAVAMRGKIALPTHAILAGQVRKRTQVFAEPFELRIDDWVRPVGGSHLAPSAGLPDRVVMLEDVARTFGRCDHLDVLAFEQGARIDIGVANPQRFHRHALRMEYPEDVVIRHQQQFGGIPERFDCSKPARVGVAVRTDDRGGE